jgi:lipopolysaccharide/colanic/teichoic acid biosynthesis glycosyltransferase
MKGYRGEVTQPSDIFRRVRYDMLYISKWSLGMDLRIIASTVKQVLFPPSSAV